MDAGQSDGAGPGLVSTGSLTSGDAPPPRRRPLRLALVGAAALAGVLLVPQLTGHEQPAGHAAPTSNRQASRSDDGAAQSNSGGPAYVIHSDGTTGRISLGPVARVQTGTDQSVLALILHLEVMAGAQIVTTESFVVSDEDGSMTRASGITVLVPGSSVAPAESGFRITAPAAVDLEVIVGVPPGVHVLSVVSATEQKLAGFYVTG